MSIESPHSDLIHAEIPAGLLETIAKPPREIAADGLANFRWQNDGLVVKTVSHSQAIAVIQRVSPEAFETYHVSVDEAPIVFGTKCKRLSKLLRNAGKTEVINLRLVDLQSRMKIKFSDVNYSLAGVEPESIQEPEIPDLSYDIRATTHSHVFDRAYQVIGLISEAIEFEVSDQSFEIRGKGDTDKVDLEIDVVTDPTTILDRDLKNAVAFSEKNSKAAVKYGSEYIKYLNEFTPRDILEISLGDDYPLRVLANWNSESVETELLIAPRLDSQ